MRLARSLLALCLGLIAIAELGIAPALAVHFIRELRKPLIDGSAQ